MPSLLAPLLALVVVLVLSYATGNESEAETRSHANGTFAMVLRIGDRLGPPLPETLVERVRSRFPEDPDTAENILRCESRAGADPDAWDLSQPDGGPMQINRATWEDVLYEDYGWTWSQVVFDLPTHLRAARVIYERAGGWEDWSCSPDNL